MISRALPALLLLAITACHAAPLIIEGEYRYGHEVNIVCGGEPEACYWLVDTAPEIRQQLKRQVQGLAQYAPVCLQLKAELSTQKADGFGLDYDGSIRVLELLGRCQENAAGVAPGIEDLQHRRWVLQSIDGLALSDFARQLGFDAESAPAKVPDLDFGKQGFFSGNTGCNQFHGQARVVDDSLILSQLATTAMQCQGFSAELELRLQLLYRNPLALSLDGKLLILMTGDSELRYRIRDWVQ